VDKRHSFLTEKGRKVHHGDTEEHGEEKKEERNSLGFGDIARFDLLFFASPCSSVSPW
jgi:hypothetical protein